MDAIGIQRYITIYRYIAIYIAIYIARYDRDVGIAQFTFYLKISHNPIIYLLTNLLPIQFSSFVKTSVANVEHQEQDQPEESHYQSSMIRLAILLPLTSTLGPDDVE